MTAGNEVFHGLVAALGLEGGFTVPLISESLRLLGATPENATPEDVANALPEIERRLRLVMPPGIADPAIGRLRVFVLEVAP